MALVVRQILIAEQEESFNEDRRIAVGTSRLSFKELETMLHVMKLIVNWRPLTVATDGNPMPITPADIMIGYPASASSLAQ